LAVNSWDIKDLSNNYCRIMKALLLRVGIDRGFGGSSPVFPDMTYEYIPIYHKNRSETEKNEKRAYSMIRGSNKKYLSEYLSEKLKNQIVHLDPEFKTFTYGDPTRTKRAALKKLEKNDLLIFYLGGRRQDSFEIGCFIFGYFVVDKVIDWDNISEDKKKGIEKEFENNAHMISSKSRNKLVMIMGKKGSKQLKKCIQISQSNAPINNPPYITIPKFQTKYGLRKNIVRAVPMYINDESQISLLQDLLLKNC